jgi:hypothetical protein
VRDALPDACIVQVIDGRRPVEVSRDELVAAGTQTVEETVGSAYRRWLTDGSGDPHVPGADLARVVELFDEIHAAVASVDTADPAEATTLARLETEELVGSSPAANEPTGGPTVGAVAGEVA